MHMYICYMSYAYKYVHIIFLHVRKNVKQTHIEYKYIKNTNMCV